MKILIATDGSEFSLEAARKCAGLISFDENTKIKIMSVVESIASGESFGVSEEYLEIVRKAADSAADAAVQEAKSELLKLLKDRDKEIETFSALGSPIESILDEADSWGADLIVLGSHGRGFWGRMLLGSVSNGISHHARCSVLVVRSKDLEVHGKRGFEE